MKQKSTSTCYKNTHIIVEHYFHSLLTSKLFRLHFHNSLYTYNVLYIVSVTCFDFTLQLYDYSMTSDLDNL